MELATWTVCNNSIAFSLFERGTRPDWYGKGIIICCPITGRFLWSGIHKEGGKAFGVEETFDAAKAKVENIVSTKAPF